jgi:hypothetical protein
VFLVQQHHGILPVISNSPPRTLRRCLRLFLEECLVLVWKQTSCPSLGTLWVDREALELKRLIGPSNMQSSDVQISDSEGILGPARMVPTFGAVCLQKLKIANQCRTAYILL